MASSIQVDETLRLVRVDSGRPLSSLICAAAVDQGALVIGTADGLIHVAHVDGPTHSYALVAFDGLQRRSPITTIRTCDGFVFFMQSPSNRILQIDKSLNGVIQFISFQDDTILSFDIDSSGLLLAGDANGSVFSWSLYADRPVCAIHSDNEPIAAVALEPNFQSAFIVTRSGRIISYDVNTNQISASNEYKLQATVAAAWHDHHGVVVADASGQVLAAVINETRFEKAHQWTEGAVVVSATVHKSGQYVALGMVNGHVVVRSLQDPTVIFGQLALDSAVVAVEFVDTDLKSPRLLVASYNGSLQIWPVNVQDGDEPAEAVDVQCDAFEKAVVPPVMENRGDEPAPALDSHSIVDDQALECSASLFKLTEVEEPSDTITSTDRPHDVDDLVQPRSGPIPIPEPPVHVAEQGQVAKAASHSLPEVGLTSRANVDVVEPRSIMAVPKPIEPCRPLPITPSIPVGPFSSKKRIDAVLNRSGRLPSDSVLATPSLNSTSWIQYQIDQLASSALTEKADIDLRAVTERAATKALHVDPAETGLFGVLPSIKVELPPPSKPQIQKQVDPKWVKSLDRKPSMDVSLNKDDLEPQIPGHDPNWSLSSSAHQRSSADTTDVTTRMGTLFMQRISYWERGNEMYNAGSVMDFQ